MLNKTQINHTATKKEFLAIVCGFENFRPYLVRSHVVVFTDHATLKYLFKKKMLSLDSFDEYATSRV